MFSNLTTIFHSSQIDKKKNKQKKMEHYIESSQQTVFKQKEQLRQLQNTLESIESKVDFHISEDSFLVEEKRNQHPFKQEEESFFSIDFSSLLDTSKINVDLDHSFFLEEKIKNLLESKESDLFSLEYPLFDSSKMNFDLHHSLFVEEKRNHLSSLPPEKYY